MLSSIHNKKGGYHVFLTENKIIILLIISFLIILNAIIIYSVAKNKKEVKIFFIPIIIFHVFTMLGLVYILLFIMFIGVNS